MTPREIAREACRLTRTWARDPDVQLTDVVMAYQRGSLGLACRLLMQDGDRLAARLTGYVLWLRNRRCTCCGALPYTPHTDACAEIPF